MRFIGAVKLYIGQTAHVV